jgi:hypothetical protein
MSCKVFSAGRQTKNVLIRLVISKLFIHAPEPLDMDMPDSPRWRSPLLCLLSSPLILEIDHYPHWIPQTYAYDVLHCVRHCRTEQMRSTLFR